MEDCLIKSGLGKDKVGRFETIVLPHTTRMVATFRVAPTGTVKGLIPTPLYIVKYPAVRAYKSEIAPQI